MLIRSWGKMKNVLDNEFLRTIINSFVLGNHIYVYICIYIYDVYQAALLVNKCKYRGCK